MKKFQIIQFIVIMAIVLLLISFTGLIKYWYIIIPVCLVYYILSIDYLSAAINYPTEENKDKSDLYNWRLWMWIFVLCIGVAGMVFCFATSNWKVFFLWLLLGAGCCYRLSKFFRKEDSLGVESEQIQTDEHTNEDEVNTENKERKKNESIVIVVCIGCVLFMMIWMVSQL